MRFRVPFLAAVVMALVFATNAFALTAPYTFSFGGATPFADTSTWQATAVRDVPPFANPGSAGPAARVARSSGTAYTFGTATNAFSPFGYAHGCASAWVYPASGTVGKPVRIIFRERTPGGTLVGSTASATLNLPSGWAQISVQRSFIGSGNKIDVYVEQKSAVSGNAIYVDDLHIDGTAGAPFPPGGC